MNIFFCQQCRRWAKGKTYMSIHQLGANIGLRVLILDGVESLLFVVVKCGFDIVETGGQHVVDMVGKENSVLHCIDRAGACARKKLERYKGGKTYERTFTNDGSKNILIQPLVLL